MLKELSLKNFRKHEELVLSFDTGLVVLRGSNEVGKSTIFQAVAYALFGAKALPQPLDEVVTFGKSAAALRATLDFTLDRVDYRIVRHKGGAELTYEGGVVTGQTEVTAFVERLLGAPAQLATSLWFANQGSIRGALGAGSKATASLIETLADFGQIDRLVDLIQSSLPCGATKPFEERLAQAEVTLKQFSEPSPPADATPKIAVMAAMTASLRNAVQVAHASQAEHMTTVFTPAQARNALAEAAASALQAARTRVENLQKRESGFVLPAYSKEEHQKLVAQLEEAKQLDQQRAAATVARKAFDALPKIESSWDGDGPAFVSFCETVEQDLVKVRSEIATAQAELSALNKAVLEGACVVCGLDYDAVPAVGTRNAEIKRERETLTAAILQFEAKRQVLEQSRLAIRAINGQWQQYRDFIAKYEAYVDVRANQVPPLLTWTAPALLDDGAYAKIKARAEYLEQAKTARIRAEAEFEALHRQLSEAQAEEAAEAKKVSDLDGADAAYAKALEEKQALESAVTQAADRLAQHKQDLEATRLAYERALEIYIERQKTWTLATEQVASASEQLAQVNFNNTLLKKVRSARPVVVDRLWSTLLAAVSHYFSAMRGVPSSVARVDGGFLVDGQPVEGLSGSTLDVLGLAIRVALLKTFLPGCSFLVLDEPAAACDEEREAALIGTIATAQFAQVVLVTHSDLADAYATQLVTL